ncbi:uncharacterized protein LOC119770686 isoform X2 [Culex quinquefasciatus]|uniref:uncharacterized protein LOC119770686 isoform X2 n=1 Tax=Culex quinquefasciatus TaxID=7176 RepID=UPI0018E39D09|nr:uncharacterized protein LOC119770686 isoform X2 [Culex quinquefasciatus]
MSSDEVFGFGLFDDIPPEGQPHPLLIDDFESDEDVGVRVKNIYAATIDDFIKIDFTDTIFTAPPRL